MCESAQAGSWNNHRPTTKTQSRFIFVNLPTLKQCPGRDTVEGTQTLLSLVHVRRSLFCCLCLFIKRSCRCSFYHYAMILTVLLWSSLFQGQDLNYSTSEPTRHLCYLCIDVLLTKHIEHKLCVSVVEVFFYITTPQIYCVPSCKVTWAYSQASPAFCSHPILLASLPLFTHSSQWRKISKSITMYKWTL